MAALWSNLEVNIGIICSCLPTLRAHVVHVFSKVFASHEDISSGHCIMTIGGGKTRQGSAGRRKKQDSIGMNILSRDRKNADVYTGRNGNLEDVEGTQISAVTPQTMHYDGDGIQVVTVVQQDIAAIAPDGLGRSDSESTRKPVKEVHL